MRATTMLGALAISVLLASPAAAAGKTKGDAGVKEAAKLCGPPYATVQFSCKTKDNYLVAVCSRADGALRLISEAVGKADGRVSLPKDPADKAGVATGSLMFSGGGGSYGRFKAAEQDYVVYSGFGRGWAQAGLAEVKEENHLAEHICLPASQPYDIGFPALGEKGGYAVDAQEFEIDVQ